jgi:lysozyme
MKLSDTGINLITKFEGLKLEAYVCPAGVATIGYGTTRYPDKSKVRIGDKLKSKEQAIDLLKVNLIEYESNVSALLYNVIINQNQYDALVSFVYNLGTGAFAGSTLLRKIKLNPNDLTIKDEFNKWVNVSGKPSNGLIRRRKEEAALYFKSIA